MKKELVVGLLVVTVLTGCSAQAEQDEVIETLHVKWDNPIEAGKYLVTITGCNDCHTDGYLMMGGQVPEEDWLMGSAVGWRGPWGTTYPTNLRLRVQEWDEETWVKTLKNRKALPPMPWMNVNRMSEEDMRAIYVYIKSLGPKGEHVPLAISPELEPQTPYLSLFPQNMPVATSQK
ncbi:c-type cytochrome [Fodinibius sp. N2]|uniref:c-type cytochrome n=1 Tax=Fodinibius alkaliphilus TaxID=3140241 RepID=UPI003159D288